MEEKGFGEVESVVGEDVERESDEAGVGEKDGKGGFARSGFVHGKAGGGAVAVKEMSGELFAGESEAGADGAELFGEPRGGAAGETTHRGESLPKR
jgi:hypothetical protein